MPPATSDFEPVPWGRIAGHYEKVAIIACGPSAAGLDLDLVIRARLAGVHVMAINDAVNWLPGCDSWFTLDPGYKNRPLMQNQKPGVSYYAAVPDDYGRAHPKRMRHKGPVEENVTFLRRDMSCPLMRAGLSEDPGTIRSGNSAFGGTGVAYFWRPRKLGLFGVDGTRRGERGRYAYAPGGPSARLSHLHELFRTAAWQLRRAGITVLNGSAASTVRCFKRADPNKTMLWLMNDD